MKGDYTRSTFSPTKRYTSVRMQQGRVPLDADWNEAQDISKHLAETARTDIIGRCGFPEDAAGQKAMQTKELKHGRIAMMAILGFVGQEALFRTPVVDETPFFFHPVF